MNPTILKRFLSSSLGKLFILLAIISVLLLLITSYNKRNNLLDEAHLELSGIAQMIKKSARDRFFQQEVMLKLLGERILEVGGLKNRDASQRLLDDLLQDNPVFVAYGIANPEGELLITSANIDDRRLPNLLKAPESASTFKQALASDHLTIGRTYFFGPLAEWVIPLRYAVRNKQDKAVMVITVALKLDGDYNPWSPDLLKEEIDIHIPLDLDEQGNFYPVYFAPFEFLGKSKADFYGNPLPKEFVETAINRMEAGSGMDFDTIKRTEATVSYVNDTPGIEPALTLISYDSRYKYFVVTRQKLSLINVTYAWHVAGYATLYLIFNIFIFTTLYRMYRMDEKLKDNLEYQALHDQLTELPNRYFLKNYYSEWLKYSTDPIALLFIDLDNFKFVNDHFGHSIGDRVLNEMSNRLSQICTSEMILVRQGGDEFIVLTRFANQAELENLLDKMIYRIREVLVIDEIKTCLSASIGVACSKNMNESVEDLLSKSDLAMYEAKKLHNSYSYFSDKMQKDSTERMVIESALHSALKQNEMHLVYQPQIDAEKGEIIGVEALIRWQHPELGMVPPDKFIAVAESCGQINAIGNFVIDTALCEFSDIQQQFDSLRLSINVSVHQLLYGGFRDFLSDKVTEHGISPGDVMIEITESLFIEDFIIIDNLLRLLRVDGFAISLDDFGTGYSSLSVLGRLPINEVKIDKSFVRDMLTDKQDKGLIKSIIGIGHSLKILTLAEGVEDKTQASQLKQFGCNLFQGYFFAKPMRLDALKQYMDSFSPVQLDQVNKQANVSQVIDLKTPH